MTFPPKPIKREPCASEFDGFERLVIAAMVRAYQDSTGRTGQLGHNDSPTNRVVVMMDGIAFFKDGRFEHMCGLIGIEDVAGLLAEIERLECAD